MRTRVALLLTLSSMLLAAPGFAADLPAIKQRGQLIAATSGNLPPVTFLNDKNELTGYDIVDSKDAGSKPRKYTVFVDEPIELAR